MIWWLVRSKLLESEKAALAELEGKVDWLQVNRWQANKDLAMCVDFQVTQNGHQYAFQMVYPSVFPDSPPMIYTEDRSRISQHQYGAGGELCLEHRPDNWHQSTTGADMVASCQRLLAEERPEAGVTLHAHSAHINSLGRDLRSKFCRFLMTQADFVAVNSLAECSPTPLVVIERHTGSAFIASICRIGSKDMPIWKSDLTIPKGDREATGVVVRIPQADLQDDITPEGLRELVDNAGLKDLGMSLGESDTLHLLIGNDIDWRLYWVCGKKSERKAFTYTTIEVPNAQQRLPVSFNDLSGKKVAIVGCGSLGSKIAASLCRSGVGSFLLIDEDILFPSNVVRNELSLLEVGVHKSYAVRDRLLQINPTVNITAHRLALGGQESAKSMAGALEALGECDLLIDATAEGIAFNIIAAASSRKKKPMIWAEVFAGGIGGYVSRARPDIDPTPLLARTQLNTWCTDQGIDWIRPDSTAPYEGQSEDDQPLIASDAEVSLIASHATRFATDILTRPNASIFPVSAYVIGFSSEWLFAQPFDTRPIDLQPEGHWGETTDQLEPEDILKLINEHMPAAKDPGANSASE